MKQKKQILKCSFSASPRELKIIRQTIRGAAAGCHCDPKTAEGLIMAANEVCANIIKHGYGEKNKGEIIMEIFHNQKELIIRFTDFAPHRDPRSFQGRKLEDLRPGGLGMHFIREFTDKINYPEVPEGVGNITELIKKW